MARGITENDVWNACDALLMEGARPTIERVRQRIGSGSPNTVSPFLDTWFLHLGPRIKDPGAFSVPSDVPDPVQQAAKHFWEMALAETRRDFDQRLSEGMSAAVANVEAEKERANRSDAAAFEAAARASRLQVELVEQGQLFDRAMQDLAAERARLEEVRGSQNVEALRFQVQQERAASEVADIKQQLDAAIQRADAADRRVAMELERERSARMKAERQAESLQKALDAARDAAAKAGEGARRLQAEARDREESLKSQVAAGATELALERQRLAQQRTAHDASAADAEAARTQVTNLQKSLDSLAAVLQAATQPHGKPTRKRAVKPTLATAT